MKIMSKAKWMAVLLVAGLFAGFGAQAHAVESRHLLFVSAGEQVFVKNDSLVLQKMESGKIALSGILIRTAIGKPEMLEPLSFTFSWTNVGRITRGEFPENAIFPFFMQNKILYKAILTWIQAEQLVPLSVLPKTHHALN